MKIITTVLMVAYTCAVCAQTENTEVQPTTTGPKHAVKAYASGLFSPYNNDRYDYRPQAETYDFVHPSVSVMIKTKRGNFHELEISEVDFKKTDITQRLQDQSGNYYYMLNYKVNDTRLALRYEYIIALIKRDNAKLIPSVGWAAMPYYYRFAQVPYITSDYPITTTILGVRSFITPRMQLNVSKRVFIDANVPICILDMGTTKQDIANPTIPLWAQKYSIVDLQAVPRYFSARLGLGVKI